MTTLSRRELLLGRAGPVPPEPRAPRRRWLRPPGAVDEARFVTLCRTCDACMRACPAGCLRPLEQPGHPAHGTAFVSVEAGGCAWCADFPCIAACPTGALGGPVQALGTARVAAHCLTRRHLFCELCRDACPPGHAAIRGGPNGWLRIEETLCVGCGRCAGRCLLAPAAIRIVPRREAGVPG